MQLTKTKRVTLDKIPDLRKSLEAVTLMKEKPELDTSTTMEISDSLHAHVRVKNPKNVCLWLGASTMVEYSVDEAHSILDEKLKTAQLRLESLNDALSALKDCVSALFSCSTPGRDMEDLLTAHLAVDHYVRGQHC